MYKENDEEYEMTVEEFSEKFPVLKSRGKLKNVRIIKPFWEV